MEIIEQCRNCNKLTGCDCRSSLVRFLSILNSTKLRVSTHKQTSESTQLSQVNVTIDKLSFNFPLPLTEADVKSRLSSAGLTSKLVKLRDRRWHLQVGSDELGIYFSLGSRSSQLTFGLISRPSAFPAFTDYFAFLNKLFNQSEINELKITRMDLAIDYKEELSSILSGFDFKRKQAQVSYTDLGGQRTGICIGRGSEKILVYDKAIESNLPLPLTRIELQLSGKKLPARNLQNLEKVLLENHWNPFSLITLNHVELPKHPETLTPSQQERLSKLTPILNREGLFSAKRVFNENRNFLRDYESIIQIQPYKEQPNDLFKKYFHNFYNPKSKEIQNGLNRETNTN